MEKIITVQTFDVMADGHALVENLKTFEEAETYIIAHDKKTHADWLLDHSHEHGRDEEFNHYRYLIFHAKGKVVADDDSTKMSFEELCDAALSWRVISLVEFKF